VDASGRFGWAAEEVARAYLEGGVRTLQLRAKQLASGPLLALAESIVGAAAPFGATVIVNDRADVARLAGAAGVHLGQEDLEPAAVRLLLGPEAVVGLSTHTIAQIDEALRQPISYLAVGPIFGTMTKNTGYEPVGLDLVRAARRRVPPGMPVVAIGGITLERAPLVIAAGASAVAVIGDLLVTGTPRARAAAYCGALM